MLKHEVKLEAQLHDNY